MSSLAGKVEADIELSIPAHKIFEVITTSPSQLSTMCPEVIQACDLLHGEWGKSGSVTHWKYLHDGSNKTAKLLLELANPTTNSITYKVIGGNLLDNFNNFNAKFKINPKHDGCRVNMSLQYEKLNEDVEHPDSLLQLGVHVLKNVDSFFTHA